MFESTRRDLLRWLGAAAFTTALPKSASTESVNLLTRRIPSSSEGLPVVGLGTYQVLDVAESGASFEEVKQVLRTFYDLGGRVVDTSPMYGASEAVLGKATAELGVNAGLFLATKVWTRGKDAGTAQMEDSLRLLRRQRLELMQVHNLLDLEAHLPTLREWKRQGRFRYIGVTHYTEGAYGELERVLERGGIDFVQINLSILEREAERTLLPLAQKNGIGVIVNRPFAGGGLFGRVRGKPLPPIAQAVGCDSWAQYFLKFIIGHPAVTCVIPATRNPKHLTDNLGAARGKLPHAQQREEMVRAFQDL